MDPRIFAATFCAMLAGAPAGAQIALPDPVESTPLAMDVFSTGTLDRAQGALAPNLWSGADAGAIGFLLDQAPTRPALPSLGDMQRRVLLSPGAGPEGAPVSLGGKKLLALARAGFSDEARTVASLSNAPRNDPWTGQALAIADLLGGDSDEACARGANLTSGRDETFWVRLRVFCYAAAGERDAADLTLAILRDEGVLSDADGVLLTAIATGIPPKSAPAPENALHLAILKRLSSSPSLAPSLALSSALSPALLTKADAGVLNAVARDAGLDPATRVAAAEYAAAAGAITGPELAVLFRSFEIDLADVGRAAEIAAARAGDPMTDAILYQAVSQMNAPEFLRDKAVMIAQALSIADSFARAYALSLLYAADIEDLEGALLFSRDAGRFALARMAVGDGEGAGRWLFAMKDSGGIGAMSEADAMAFIELTNLLAVLDPASAAIVASSANVSIAPAAAGNYRGGDDGDNSDDSVMARIVDIAFDAAMNRKTGQAALAALAASANAAPGAQRVRDVVVSRSLRIAGLEDVRRRMAFERAWTASFPENSSSRATIAAAQPAARSDDDGFTPRLKPRKRP